MFFGVCTTLVNVMVYWMAVHLFAWGVMSGTVLAWVIAVLFAYVTNRKWVFHSKSNTRDSIIKEIFSFFSCRFATGIIDWGYMYVFVDLLHLNDVTVKFTANLLVIILNYVASKLVIFKKRETE